MLAIDCGSLVTHGIVSCFHIAGNFSLETIEAFLCHSNGKLKS